MWVAGVASGVGAPPGDTTGRFDGNNAKDVYARFDYKIGGMGLDGDTGGQRRLRRKGSGATTRFQGWCIHVSRRREGNIRSP